jgi:hypothetical protein
VETVKHPVKSFKEHPIGTALILRGVEGAVGHGIGKGMRISPNKKIRAAASTKREPLAGPGGMRAQQGRTYSRDVFVKSAQVAKDKRRARKGTSKQMGPRELERRLDETVAAGKSVSRHREAVAHKRAKKALGRKPTAAVTLTAQGITRASRKDLEGYLASIREEAKSLTGSELKANQTTQKAIVKALKKHDDARVQAAAQDVSKALGEQEQRIVDQGPRQARHC